MDSRERREPPGPTILSVREIAKSFGGLHALDTVSIDATTGRITAVIGPNGAGKSTLFNVITGVENPSSGKIVFKGRDITHWPAHRITKAGIGRTFQNARLFRNLNVIENVMAARYCRTRSTFVESVLSLPRARTERKETVAQASKLLHDLGIYNQRFALPRELPYGDQRRAEVARALATEPELLLLDEPAAGMTHHEAESFRDVIHRLTKDGMTIVLIDHNMTFVMPISDRIIVLNFGVKLAEGTPTEIQSRRDVIDAYLGT